MKNALSTGYKKFLLLWSGEFISAVGGGLSSFGLSVYIFQQTGSAANVMQISVGRGAALVISGAGVLLLALTILLYFMKNVRRLES